MMRLNLEWKVLDKDHVSLIFDKPAWLAFQSIADIRGIDTGDMITEALAKLLGTVMAKPAQD